MFERVPHGFRYVLLEDDTLDDACAVAQLREQELAARTQVVKPTVQGHCRADVRGELVDVNGRRSRAGRCVCFGFRCRHN